MGFQRWSAHLFFSLVLAGCGAGAAEPDAVDEIVPTATSIGATSDPVCPSCICHTVSQVLAAEVNSSHQVTKNASIIRAITKLEVVLDDTSAHQLDIGDGSANSEVQPFELGTHACAKIRWVEGGVEYETNASNVSD